MGSADEGTGARPTPDSRPQVGLSPAQRQLLDALPDAIVVSDADDTIVFANRATRDLLGWDPEALVGRDLGAVVPVRHREGSPSSPAGDRQTPEGRPVRGSATRPDGTEVEADVLWTPASLEGRRLVLTTLRPAQGDAERQELLDRLRLAERRQRFLAEVSRVLATSLDRDAMLASLARAAVGAVADVCTADVLDEDGSLRRVGVAVNDPSLEEQATALKEYSPFLGRTEGAARVMRTGNSVLYPRISDALLVAVARDAGHLELLRRLRPTSAMAVPLPGRGRTLGTLTFASLTPGQEYGPDDLALAEEVGRRAGLAIANAALYERERAVATTLQRSLLPPRLPTVPGIDLAARLEPGGDGAVVGGDFYDLFAVGGGRWAAAIGDVCGVGAEAAAVTAQVRYSLRSLAAPGTGPDEILTRINRLLLEQGTDVRFCTALYAMLEPTGDAARLVVASAGHPWPLLLRGGTVEELACPGSLLGVVDDPHVRERAIDLRPGDVLLLYTDGVTETRRSGELFGEDRLRSLLASSDGLPAREVADRIVESVLEFGAGVPNDDLAVLVLRVLGGGRHHGAAAGRPA